MWFIYIAILMEIRHQNAKSCTNLSNNKSYAVFNYVEDWSYIIIHYKTLQSTAF